MGRAAVENTMIASAMMPATAGMPALRMYTRFSGNQKFVCDGEKRFLKNCKLLEPSAIPIAASGCVPLGLTRYSRSKN
jgi:hypothetical protein